MFSMLPRPGVTVRLPSAAKSTVNPCPLSTRNAGPPGSPGPEADREVPVLERERERAVAAGVDERVAGQVAHHGGTAGGVDVTDHQRALDPLAAR